MTAVSHPNRSRRLDIMATFIWVISAAAIRAFTRPENDDLAYWLMTG